MKFERFSGLLLVITWSLATFLFGVAPCYAEGSEPSPVAASPSAPIAPASAPEKNLPQTLTLQQAFEMALENSRAVQGARFKPLQAAEEYNKARAIYDPAVFLLSTAERTDRPTESLLDGVPLESALIEDRWQVQAGVKARSPTGGSVALYQEGGRYETNNTYTTPNPQYRSRVMVTLNQALLKGIGDQEGATGIAVAGLNRQIAEASFKSDVVGILREISQSYWQLFYEQNVVRVAGESLHRAEEVYSREKIRTAQGLSKPVDADRALSAVRTRQSNLLRAKNQARLTSRQLWLLLAPERMFSGRELPDFKLSDIPHGEFSKWERRDLLDTALNHRYELAMARDTVNISRQQKNLAEHNQLPNLDLKLDYGFSGLNDEQDHLAADPYDDDYNNWQVELSFEWPLGGRSAAAEKSRGLYRLRQSQEEMRLAAERITLDIDMVLDELRLAREELQVTKAAMEAALRVMKGEEVLFELGQKDNQDLLTVQDYYGAAEKEYLQAQTRYNINLVALAWARGTLLNDYGLNLDGLLNPPQDEQ